MKFISEKQKTLLDFLSVYKKQLQVLVLLGAVSALLDSGVLIGLFDFTRFVIHQDFSQSHFLKTVLDRMGISSFSFQTIALLYAGVIGSVVLMRFFSNIFFEKRSYQLRGQALIAIQEKVMQLYLSIPWRHFLQKKQGEMMFHLINLPAKSSEVLIYVCRIFLTTIVFSVICGVLVLTSPPLFLVSIILGAIYFIFIRTYEKSISYKERVDSSRLQSAVASEALAGMRYLRSYGYEEIWFKRFSFQVKRFASLISQDDFWIVLPPKVLEALIVFGLLFFITVFLSFTNQNFVGAIPVLCLYFFGLLRLLPAMSQLGNAYVQLQRNFPYVESFEQLMKDQPVESTIQRQDSVFLKDPVSLVLESIHFSYESGRPILNNLSLDIKAGKITALTGPSGSGKSTLLDLILGFLKPEKGRILVNGISLRDMDLKEWRSHIAYVGQDVFLFHDTIEANLKMGLPTISWKELEEVARISGILTFIESLPEKWNTLVGDRGIKLSGGQRQRLALARALLRNPSIYILDEPTSALDIETEQSMMKSFLNYVRSKTVILVAHRLETIRYAECVVLLDKGKIINEGCDPLLRRKRTYDDASVR